MAVNPVAGAVAAREAPALILSPQGAEIARAIGFPPELGDAAALFVRGDLTDAALVARVRASGFEPDSSLGSAVIDAARVMNKGRPDGLVFDLSRLDNQSIQVRARAWSALRRMTDQISPPAERPPVVAPEGQARRVPGNARPQLAAPRQSAAPTTLPDHTMLRGTSLDFRAAFARPENQRLVFSMLLEREPKSLTEGLEAVEARYPGARSNLQQVVSGLQFSLTQFGYTGNQEGMPNAAMARSLEFAREQVRPHLAGAHTRTEALARAKAMNLGEHHDLLAAIDGATLGWRVMDVVAGPRNGAGS